MNFSSMQHAPTPSAEQQGPGVPAIDDGFYGGALDLGHATQINNDLARSIKEEIRGIDESLRRTSGLVKTEERSLGQLTRDCSNRRDEMFGFRRDAAEILDSEAMQDDIRAGFKDQFANEVGPHLVSPAASDAGRDGRGPDAPSDEEDGDGNGGGPAPPGAATPRAFSHKKFIDRKRTESRDRRASIHAIQRDIKETRKKIRAANDDAARYNREVVERQLERVKVEGERQVEARRKELEAEKRRRQSVKEAIEVARANSGAYAQQITDKVNEQKAERNANEAKEKALESLNAAKAKELSLLEDEERKLDMELAALSGQLDFFVKQAAEFEALQRRSADMKVEAEEVEREIAELAASKEAKAKEAEASGADLQSALAAFGEATKAVAEANAEKLENDKAVVEVLEPAKARKDDAFKEKERLAGEVVALQESIEKAQSSNKDAANNSDAKVLTKSNELKEHKAKLEEMTASFEETKRKDAEELARLQKSIEENREFACKFEAATKAEMDRLDQQKSDAALSRINRLEKRRAELAKLEDAHRADVDNLREMATFLGEMKELRAKIEEAPLLTESGEENFLTFDCEIDDDAASVENHTG